MNVIIWIAILLMPKKGNRCNLHGQVSYNLLWNVYAKVPREKDILGPIIRVTKPYAVSIMGFKVDEALFLFDLPLTRMNDTKKTLNEKPHHKIIATKMQYRTLKFDRLIRTSLHDSIGRIQFKLIRVW